MKYTMTEIQIRGFIRMDAVATKLTFSQVSVRFDLLSPLSWVRLPVLFPLAEARAPYAGRRTVKARESQPVTA